MVNPIHVYGFYYVSNTFSAIWEIQNGSFFYLSSQPDFLLNNVKVELLLNTQHSFTKPSVLSKIVSLIAF